MLSLILVIGITVFSNIIIFTALVFYGVFSSFRLNIMNVECS